MITKKPLELLSGISFVPMNQLELWKDPGMKVFIKKDLNEITSLGKTANTTAVLNRHK